MAPPSSDPSHPLPGDAFLILDYEDDEAVWAYFGALCDLPELHTEIDKPDIKKEGQRYRLRSC